MHEVLVMRTVDEDENTKCMPEPEAKEVLHTHVYRVLFIKNTGRTVLFPNVNIHTMDTT